LRLFNRDAAVGGAENARARWKGRRAGERALRYTCFQDLLRRMKFPP